MRFLTVVRHAKAERPEAGVDDYDRVLTARGRRQCDQLRGWAENDDELGRFGPVTALVSSAARTRETFRRSFDATPFVVAQFESRLIYNGLRDVTGEDLLRELVALDPVTTSLLVVAHNPTVLEFVWMLAESLPPMLHDNYPLAGAYVLSIGDEPLGPSRYPVVTSYVPD